MIFSSLLLLSWLEWVSSSLPHISCFTTNRFPCLIIMTFDNVPKFCRTLLVPCSRLPNLCALSIFSFTWQIPSSFFKIVYPYKCSIRFYNTRLTQTLNFNDCFGRLHNDFWLSFMLWSFKHPKSPVQRRVQQGRWHFFYCRCGEL